LFNVDPTLLRLAFVFLVIPTGIIPLILVYAAAWLIVPEEPDSTPPAPAA